MTTFKLACEQLDACAKYFPGVWFLYVDIDGYHRTTDVTAVFGEILYTASR